MDKFLPGHYYYNANDMGSSPVTMRCRKSILFGLQLAPIAGLLKVGVSCSDPNVQSANWIDCTEQVKRSEAMKSCVSCQLVPVTKDLIGTIISYPSGHGTSGPMFMYAYDRQIAYLMTLDGCDTVFNRRLTQCYPLQKMYTDVATRAVSSDPIQSSIFDGLFRWLKTTPQYSRFLNAAELVPTEDREDMIKLFELMSFEGITADAFEAEVRRRYDTLAEEDKAGLPIYTAVLEHYKNPAKAYTKIEQEIMRSTNFKFKTPQEAWRVMGQGKPYPKTLQDATISPPRKPEQVVADTIGLYSTPLDAFWFSNVCLSLGYSYSFDTEWEKGLEAYMKEHPEFDEGELLFIKEEDKAAVFRQYLGVEALDPRDPYRAWVKDPPLAIKEAAKENPDVPYVQLFKKLYLEDEH